MMEVKTVGTSGQISLGKEYAGRMVMVEELETGIWMIRTAQVIPDNEMWLHTSPVRESLDRALAISSKSKRAGSDLDAIGKKIRQSK